MVTNMANVDIQLVDYNLNLRGLNETHSPLNDPNESTRGTVLQVNQNASFLFPMSYDSTVPGSLLFHLFSKII